jgi:hypothetical protein
MSDAKIGGFKDMALDMDKLSEHYSQSLLGIKSPTKLEAVVAFYLLALAIVALAVNVALACIWLVGWLG